MPRPDVLVIGAGTTGAVLAARLIERGRSVLVLEAGPEPARDGLDPFAALGAPGRTWDGLVATRSRAQGPQPYWQGRGVGGTSAINGMMATWPPPVDYDRWRRDGWSSSELQPAIRRIDATLTLQSAPAGPVNAAFAASARRLGVECEPARFTIDGARRVTVTDAWGVTAHTGAHVDRVVLDGRRAVGVRLADGEEIEAGEVVLSAGAIHSPAILLRSGIDRAGLGRNLQDHPAVRAAVHLRAGARMPDRSRLPFSVVGRTDHVQLVPMDYADDLGAGGVTVALMDASSSGTVALASSDPRVEPTVEFDLLANERDVAALQAGVVLLERMLDQPPLRRIAEAVQLPDVQNLASHLGDVYHAAGTCRMGDPSDDRAVVDTHGRVLGYVGLRVADASIMPTLPRANPMLTCVLIAERLAERWLDI